MSPHSEAIGASSAAGIINMRLYSGKIGPMVDDLVRDLTAGEDIEVEDVAEVRLDLEAVLKEYVRRERQVIDDAKDRMEREGLGYSKLGRMRQRVAKEMGFPQPMSAPANTRPDCPARIIAGISIAPWGRSQPSKNVVSPAKT